MIRSDKVLPAKSDSDVMFCLQSYQGLIIDRSFVSGLLSNCKQSITSLLVGTTVVY